MTCGVVTCSINDDRYLWRCVSCSKKYHAACVGVQRHREEFIRAFMAPVCADCQTGYTEELNVQQLFRQQEQLLNEIKKQSNSNYRLSADLRKLNIVHELFDSMESQLVEVSRALAEPNKTNMSARATANQQHSKNTSLLDDLNESNQRLFNNTKMHVTECVSHLAEKIDTQNEAATTKINCCSLMKKPNWRFWTS